MKKLKYGEARQALSIFKQAEGASSVQEFCREYGMSTAVFYKWRCKYDGMNHLR